MYLQNLDYQNVNLEIQKPTNQISQVFIDQNEQMQTAGYNISTVTIPNEVLKLNLNIKKKNELDEEAGFTTQWLCSVKNENDRSLFKTIQKF